MTAAEKLSQAVSERGITLTHIAQKANMSVDAVSRSFAGKRRLQADEMICICNAIGIDLRDLCENQGPKAQPGKQS